MQNSDGTLDHLDIRSLRLLASLLESRTAEALGMSQPSASRALSRLQRALGDRLLVRRAGGSVLTPRAEALKPCVAEALAAIGRVFAPADFDAATSRVGFSIATTDYGADIVLAPLAAALARKAPALRVEAVPWGPRPWQDWRRDVSTSASTRMASCRAISTPATSSSKAIPA